MSKKKPRTNQSIYVNESHVFPNDFLQDRRCRWTRNLAAEVSGSRALRSGAAPRSGCSGRTSPQPGSCGAPLARFPFTRRACVDRRGVLSCTDSVLSRSTPAPNASTLHAMCHLHALTRYYVRG